MSYKIFLECQSTVIVTVLFKWACCWDFMGVAFFSYVDDNILQKKFWTLSSLTISSPIFCSAFFLRFVMCIKSLGLNTLISCSSYFGQLLIYVWFPSAAKEVSLLRGESCTFLWAKILGCNYEIYWFSRVEIVIFFLGPWNRYPQVVG